MKNVPGNKLNQRTRDALTAIAENGEFAGQIERLLNTLGYTSERKPLEGTENIREIVEQKTAKTKADQLLMDESLTAEVIFQVTNKEVQQRQQESFLEEGKSFNGGCSSSFIFSCAELKGDSYNRTDLANMTRAVNRVYSGTPSVVLFKYADKLSVGLIGRRPHKRQEKLDVLLKVSLIKDIDLKNPHRAHVDILTELSLAHRLRWMESEKVRENFDGLLKSWLATLDIRELNKRFYRELSDWFRWAKSETSFPAEKKQEEHIMRLLVRILFVWFIKEKGLVAEQLFNPAEIDGLLKEFNTTTKSDSYYRAILQNLFFATLNTKIEERAFSSRQQKTHRDFNLYRYKDQMKTPSELRALFDMTPFINGGLFDCQDDFEGTKEGGRRIDCFSDNKSVWKQVSVPDCLFFAPVNSRNGAIGLIELLKSYKFTVEENTPIEQDVALDPELLGQVFEELLDEIDSDQKGEAQSHRKDTGSYYTPREVVDYMVNETLITRLSRSGIAEDELDYLLDYAHNYDDAGDFFGLREKEVLVGAIANLRILDPAVGSGAFPMGILNKLNLALHRLDPDNEIWKKVQIDLATQRTRTAYETEVDNEKARKEQLDAINDNFEKHKGGFGRKLYLIQSCIFGVDIQPIACQIAKLRFFISLAIEQSSNDNPADNYGVQPLPNLETRFVVADTLIAQNLQWQLPMAENVGEGEAIEEATKILNRLNNNRERYFNAKNRNEKRAIRKENKNLRAKLASELTRLNVNNNMALRIANWDPYDQNACAEWFDPSYMFGIQDGFDIVIGNPPYIQLQKNGGALANRYKDEDYDSFIRTGDIYILFYERGHKLLAPDGYLCYITSHQWLRTEYGGKLRTYLPAKARPLLLVDFRTKVFDAGVDVNILLLGKQPVDNPKVTTRLIENLDDLGTRAKGPEIELVSDGSSWLIPTTKTELTLKTKIEKIGTPLKNWKIKVNRGITVGYNPAFIITAERRREILADCSDEAERQRTKNLIRPLLRGKNIDRYGVNKENEYIIVIPSGLTEKNKADQAPEKFFENNYSQIYRHLKSFEHTPSKGKGLINRDDQGDYWWELRPCDYYAEFEKEKLIWSELTQRPQFVYDEEKAYILNTGYMITGRTRLEIRYLCGVLNSILGGYIFRKYYASGLGKKGIRYLATFVKRLPAPLMDDTNRVLVNEIESLVDCITDAKKKDHSANTNDWEQKIDELVYQLYGLDDAEIKMVEDAVKSWQ